MSGGGLGLDFGLKKFAVSLQEMNQVPGGHHGLAGHAFMGAGADVGGDDGLGVVQQWMIGRRRFLVHDIGGVTGELAGVEGLKDGGSVD